MSKMKFLVGGILFILVQGCMEQPIPVEAGASSSTTTIPEIDTLPSIEVGIGIDKVEKVQHYSSPLNANYYYGQLLIEPNIASNVFSKTASKTFLDYISELFHDHKKSFALSVTPMVDGLQLPDIVLIAYTYDSQSKSWKTLFNENRRTGRILLKPTTELNFRFNFVSMEQRNFDKIINLTSFFKSGAWLLTPAVRPIFSTVTQELNHLMSHSVTSSVSQTLVPVDDAIKSLSYKVKFKNGQPLANVKFSLLLSDSVLHGNFAENHLNEIPKINKLNNPLKEIPLTPKSTKTLYDDLREHVSLRKFAQIEDSKMFRDECHNILNIIQHYGLNPFDKLNAFAQILDRTDFSLRPKLYTSGCLQSYEFKLLEEMGIPMVPPPAPKPVHVHIDDDVLNKISGYLKSPIANVGHRSDLTKLFANTLFLSVPNNDLLGFDDLAMDEYPTPVTGKQIMERFSKVGVAKVGAYQYRNLGKHHITLFFRALSSATIYKMRLSRQHPYGYISSVTITPAVDDDLRSSKKRALERTASTDVEGYKNDIMHQKNGEKIALNN